MAYFSNGTEGEGYREQYCDKCANDNEEMGCAVWGAHLLFEIHEGPQAEVLRYLIPDGINGFAEKCQMFRGKQLNA